MEPSALTSHSQFVSGASPQNGGGLLPVLCRRWVLVVCVTAGCIAAAAVYLAFARPVYVSAARLQVRPSVSKSIDIPSSVSPLNGVNFLSTQCEVIKSTPVLTGALKQLAPAELNDGADQWITDVKNDLTAEPGKKDDLIRVSFAASSPEEAANLVNAVVASYIEFVGQLRRAESVQLLELLQTQMDQCQADSSVTAAAMRNFREKNPDIPYDNDHASVVSQRLTNLSESFTRDRLQSIAMQSEYDSAKSLFGQRDGAARCAELYREKGDASLLDRNRDELRASLDQMKQRQAVMAEYFLPSHPFYIGLQNIITELQKQIDSEDLRQANVYLSQTYDDWQQAIRREREDEKELTDQRQEVEKANSAAIAYADLRSDLDRTKKREDELDTRIKSLGVDKDTGALDVAVVEPAAVTSKPAKPEPAKVLAVAAAFGLILGVGAAIHRDHSDTRLRSSEAIVSAFNLPVLGVMPRLSGAVMRSPDALAACQIIRRGISLKTAELATTSILLCSSDPHAGTTTLVRQLAASYARNGKTVVYVDTAREGSQARTDDSIGWRHLLAGTHTLNAIVQCRDADGFDVLSPGSGDGASLDACLEASTLAPVLAQLCSWYQVVLINGPVVSPLGEACMWASVCDATVLVLSADTADRASGDRAIQSLRDVGAEVIGAVVNRVSKRDGYRVLGFRTTSEEQQNAAAGPRSGAQRRQPSQAA